MKGKKQFEDFKAGKPLSYRGAILAQCFECSGYYEDPSVDGSYDCLGVSCPLYQHMPYRKGRTKKTVDPARRAELSAQLKKGRETALKQRQGTEEPKSEG